MPTTHGPFKINAGGMSEAMTEAHARAQALAPGSVGKVSTRLIASGTTEDGRGNVYVWIEFSVQIDD